MMALWGNLNICPHLNYLELLYHMSGELLSISHLKVWGDIQEPCNDMAYLLVHTGDASGAENYGMALVWISLHQVQASTIGSRDTVCLHLQWSQLAICSCTAI